MLFIKKETYANTIVLIILSLICPVVVIAPLGTWIPLGILGVVSIFFLKDRLKGLFTKDLNLIVAVAFIWILLNVFFILRNFYLLEKVFQIFFLIASGIIASKLVLDISNEKKAVVIFSISFIFSSVLVILDTKYNLGLKLWLSKNFDFNNFENFYKLKYWVSLSDFKTKYSDLIITYNQNSYSRGVMALIIFSFPLFSICIFYNYKILAYVIVLINFLLAFLTSNLSIIFCTTIAFFFGVIYYFKTKNFKKYFIWILGMYFLSCPFFLGQIDYRKFSEYENNLVQKRHDILIGYCDNNHFNNSMRIINNGLDSDQLPSPNIKKITLYIKCFKFDEKLIGPFPNKYNHVYYNLVGSENSFENIETYMKYIFYTTFSTKIHRLIIWSYVKEKILEKPFFGHGFLSSRHINSEVKETKSTTRYELIPLHPHNSILEIWLELGLLGVIIFFIFIHILLKRINNFDVINHKVATVAIISFFQILFVGQISFSFWQSWWIAVILITFILYKIVFKLYGFYEPRSDPLN